MGKESVVLVEDTLTQDGWRRVHFVSGDAKAFQRKWNQTLVGIPWESADAVITDRYTEAGIEHGIVHWPLRGKIVEYRDLEEGPEDGTMVLWVLFGKKDRVSQAVKTCAYYYYAYFDVWPDTAWVGSSMAAHDGKRVAVEGRGTIGMVYGAWLPEFGVGVGRMRQLASERKGV